MSQQQQQSQKQQQAPAAIQLQQLAICPYCDLVMHRHEMGLHQLAKCPRCDSKVAHRHQTSINLLLFTLVAAWCFYFPANFYPLVQLEIANRITETSVFNGVVYFVLQQHPITAAIVLFCCLLVPALVLLLFSVLLLARQSYRGLGMQKFCIRSLVLLREWSMMDIYLLSFLVTMFKLNDLGKIELQVGFMALVGLTLSINKLFISYDRAALWGLLSVDSEAVK